MMTAKQAIEQKTIGRLIKIGKSVYCTFPPAILKRAGLAKGDNVMLDSAGGAVVVQRIPWEIFKRAEKVVKEMKARKPARALKPAKHAGESEAA